MLGFREDGVLRRKYWTFQCY